MAKKISIGDDPVIAELLKRKAETDAEINRKIKERRAQLGKAERTSRNRVHMLVGIAYVTDAHTNPELLGEMKERLDRVITNPKDRAFLVSKTWLDKV